MSFFGWRGEGGAMVFSAGAGRKNQEINKFWLFMPKKL